MKRKTPKVPLPTPSLRQRKVNALLQQQIAGSLTRWDSAERSGVLVTVTAVEVTPDLREARVWVSVWGEEAHQVLKRLRTVQSEIQSDLFHTLALRPVPKIHFALDTGQAVTSRLTRVMRSLHDDRKISA